MRGGTGEKKSEHVVHPHPWVCHATKTTDQGTTRYNSLEGKSFFQTNFGVNFFLLEEMHPFTRQTHKVVSTKVEIKYGVRVSGWLPGGGELKAKQDGVVLPGASRLSLGRGGNWSITDQAADRTRVGIGGRVTPTGQMDIWTQCHGFSSFRKVLHLKTLRLFF